MNNYVLCFSVSLGYKPKVISVDGEPVKVMDVNGELH